MISSHIWFSAVASHIKHCFFCALFLSVKKSETGGCLPQPFTVVQRVTEDEGHPMVIQYAYR